MNIFEYRPEQLVSFKDYEPWVQAWREDFRNISYMIQQMKRQASSLSRLFDTENNSSFIGAGRSISQKNLNTCKIYARNLMAQREYIDAFRYNERVLAKQAKATETSSDLYSFAVRASNLAKEFRENPVLLQTINLLLKTNV